MCVLQSSIATNGKLPGEIVAIVFLVQNVLCFAVSRVDNDHHHLADIISLCTVVLVVVSFLVHSHFCLLCVEHRIAVIAVANFPPSVCSRVR